MNTTTQRGTHGRSGMILFAVLCTIGGVAMIAATMFVVASTNLKIAGNFRDSQKAFFQTDSGVRQIKSTIETALAAGTLQLTGAEVAVSFAAPAGYNFDTVRSLTRCGNGPAYQFVVTGRQNNAETRIVTTFRRRPALSMGVFGDQIVDAKADGSIYSYYSDRTPTPTPADSTGEADSGSNNDFITHMDTFIDGDLIIGKDDFGNAGVWANPGSGATISGDAGTQVEHVDDDPLGAVGGPLATTFTSVAGANNNSTATQAIPGNNRISLGNGDTMTLRAGNYYVSQINLGNGATLTIDASSGPVNIYLTGAMDLGNGSSVNIVGKPTDFAVYSNSSQDIQIRNNTVFKGLVYAPLADVSLNHNGDFYGVIWSDSVVIRNSGDFFIDLTLLSRVVSTKIELLTWKEARL